MNAPKTMRERMNDTVDDLRYFIERVCREKATPEEIAVLPNVALALTNMLSFAVLDAPKDD